MKTDLLHAFVNCEEFVNQTRMTKNCFLAAGFLLMMMGGTTAQTVTVPLTLNRWDTLGANITFETYMGKESVLLKSGFMSVKNADLRDGTIEADISFPGQRGFPGLVFRMQDMDNLENFYVRPHQSGNPDATQYTPVFNGQAGWQLYHGEGYSKEYTFRFEQWHHVKIDMHGLQAEIYIDDMKNPLIKVAELLNGWKKGAFGLVAGGVPLRFADVQYTPKEGAAPAAIPVPATGTGGLITQWHVSDVVNRNLFLKKYQLNPAIKGRLKWTTQHTEPSGTINLARFGKLADSANAMVAKVLIDSKTEQMKLLHFGFSDFVIVYLNDKAFYSGSDAYRSRDYRFLGTIGYFDGLILPLKKGVNELWFVVAESFGGWGLKAKFEDMNGILLK